MIQVVHFQLCQVLVGWPWPVGGAIEGILGRHCSGKLLRKNQREWVWVDTSESKLLACRKEGGQKEDRRRTGNGMERRMPI